MNISFFNQILASITERGRALTGAGPRRPGAGGDLAEMCEALYSGLGEASGAALAADILAAYKGLDATGRKDFFHLLTERFGPDHAALMEQVEKLAADPGDRRAAARLHEVSEPRRQELIRRLNLAPGGTAQLVAMREDLLGFLDGDPGLDELDRDFVHLFSSWFNRGFLVIRRIDWSTPAIILEKIILHEAVHAIKGWEDLRRRIDPEDRRLYAFFHPALVDEPLIFVEVALLTGMPSAIAPILAGDRERFDAERADTAAFYSLSNCQEGLRGIKFGNFLIKQVVEDLRRELPNLRTFVTLSPVPGFSAWLARARARPGALPLGGEAGTALDALDRPGWHRDAKAAEGLRRVLLPLCAHYLLREKTRQGRPRDPVARFHLRNGAELARLDWLADLSERGLAQSAGIMVNYRYDLAEIEKNHELYANQNFLAAASAVKSLLPDLPRDFPDRKAAG